MKRHVNGKALEAKAAPDTPLLCATQFMRPRASGCVPCPSAVME